MGLQKWFGRSLNVEVKEWSLGPSNNDHCCYHDYRPDKQYATATAYHYHHVTHHILGMPLTAPVVPVPVPLYQSSISNQLVSVSNFVDNFGFLLHHTPPRLSLFITHQDSKILLVCSPSASLLLKMQALSTHHCHCELMFSPHHCHHHQIKQCYCCLTAILVACCHNSQQSSCCHSYCYYYQTNNSMP